MISTLHIRLIAGDTDLTMDTGSMTARRGLNLDGVTDQPGPAATTVVVKGSAATDPLTNEDLRPDRPIEMQAGIEDAYGTDITWHTIWTGKILRGRIEHDESAKHDPDAYRLQVTVTDIVPTLAALPCEVAVSGTLEQRVDAVMAGTGVDYAVTDLETPGPNGPLGTNQRTVLGQLRLIRDTLHASMFVDRHGVLQVVADNARPRTTPVPDHFATDEDLGPEAAIRYHDITPVFDTDSAVNVLTIETVGDETPQVFTDEESRAAWGSHSQTVTVNDGLPETHAGLYLATRTDPDLIPERLAFVVDPLEPTFAAHLAAACALEINDSIHVTRLGRVHQLAVLDVTHGVTVVLDPVPRLRWTVDVGLRVPDVLATRWDDVPADLTWDDLPPDLTWDDAVRWWPYLEGA